MRCYICEAVLAPEEVHYNNNYEGQKYGPYDPCGRCLAEIDEAFEDPLSEEEIDDALEDTDQLLLEFHEDAPF
jgi:hypothetical protein